MIASAAIAVVLVSTASSVTDGEQKRLATFDDFDVEVQSFAGTREFARMGSIDTEHARVPDGRSLARQHPSLLR